MLATVVTAFLHAYTARQGIGWTAGVAHLEPLIALLCFALAVRLALAKWFGAPGAAVAALLFSLLPLLMAVYYALVLVGLAFWGQVISWRLIVSYLPEAQALVATFGLHPPTVLAGALILLVGYFGAALAWGGRMDFVRSVAQSLPTRTAVLLVAAGVVLGSSLAGSFLNTPPVASREPLAMTLFPELAGRRIQSTMAVDQKEALASAEHARESYVVRAAPVTNVILVVVDALRADRVEDPALRARAMPHLDRMVKSGVLKVIPGTRSVCTESSCGLLSLARARFVHEQSDRDFTLYEMMRRNGYVTRLMLGGDHTNFYGLREAYGDVDQYIDGASAPPGSMNDDRWLLQQVKGLPRWTGRPHFMQLHWMSCHPLGRRDPAYAVFQPHHPYSTFRIAQPKDRISPERARNHYDNGVYQFDAYLRQALQALSSKGYLKNTLLVITSDHGELLGEHGQYSHSGRPLEPALRVPLLVARFGGQSPHWDRAAGASVVDIAPSIATELGVQVPSSWTGVPLQKPLAQPLRPFQQGNTLGVHDYSASDTLFKYARDFATGEESVHELVSDPEETENMVNGIPAERLQKWRKAVFWIAGRTLR